MPAVIGTLSIAALQALTAAKEPRELRFLPQAGARASRASEVG